MQIFIWCLDEGDRHYFRSSRERDLGCSLEEACADRAKWCAAFEGAIAPLERTLTEQSHLGGVAPDYVDYVVFSVFQWARLGSPQDILRAGTAVHAWRERMIGLFDKRADRFPPFPIQRSGTDARNACATGA